MFAALLGVLLVGGLFSLRLIPVYKPLWGLDFQNVYAYQTCEEVRDAGLYSVSGEVCGDELGRSFGYPPALYNAFSWVGWFTLTQAVFIWDVVMIIGMLVVGMIWLLYDRRASSGWRRPALAAFWVLLMAQFPFAFALERGNNDVIPVILWTAATGLFLSQRYVLSGVFTGLAVVLKVYPAIAAALLFVGVLRTRWNRVVRFAVGGIIGGVLSSIWWWDLTVEFVTEVIPVLSNRLPSISLIAHTLGALQLPGPASMGITVALFGSWGFASWHRLHRDPVLIFAGALAISTYFSAISWDYNLVTAYPLLLVVTSRAIDPERSHAWKVASFASVLSIAAGRGFFSPAGQTLSQVAVLTGIAWLSTFDPDSSDSSMEYIDAQPLGGALISPDSTE